jgi:hypothetical protein
VTAAGKTERARENRAYVRRLLAVKQPDFLAALQVAERQVDRELSGQSPLCNGRIRNGSFCENTCVDLQTRIVRNSRQVRGSVAA